MMTKKIGLTTLCTLLLWTTLPAQEVSLYEAKQEAKQFLNVADNELMLVEKVQDDPQHPILYCFTSKSSYVVISAHQNCVPILAYSFDNGYPTVEVSPFKMWLDHYSEQIRMMYRQSDDGFNFGAPNRTHTISAIISVDDQIAPFITSKWDQTKFYNYYCPKDVRATNYNGRTLTGCVATTLAQILYYYRFPTSGVGSYSYTDDTYGVQTVDYSAATYLYNQMTDKPAHINTAISQLMYHLGVSVDMVYGIDGSGMYNHKAAHVLKTYFKFVPETQYLFRDNTTLDWDSVIVSHLERRIPLYYAGWSVPNINGHAFICDGYQKMEDDRYYYHFNFGWSGQADGNFYTDHLNPSGYNFNLSQELVINAYPDTNLYTYPACLSSGDTTLSSESGSFIAGKTALYSCPNVIDYSWHILPDIDYYSSIKLDFLYDLSAEDTVWISSTTAGFTPLLLTGDSALFSQTLNVSDLTILLKSSGNGAKTGIKGNYLCQYQDQCTGTGAILTAASGTLQDGSGNNNYQNCQRCQYRIRINNATTNYISLHFNQFETVEDEDYLYFYDATQSNDPTLIGQISGNHTGEDLHFNTRFLTIVFESSEATTAAGWQLNYTSGHSAINEITKELTSCTVYPNPTQSTINIRVSQTDEQVLKTEIYDLQGRKIGDFGALNKVSIATFPEGIYLLKIYSNRAQYFKKIMKID